MSHLQITLRGDRRTATSNDDSMMEEGEQAQPQHQSSNQNRVIITSNKKKGRGFGNKYQESTNEDRYAGQGGEFESIEDEGGQDAQKSVEGWLIIVTNLHEETNEDDLYELFADHGAIKQLHLNLDRRTGFVKGYALIQYESYKEAQSAINSLQGHQLHEKPLTVAWAFKPTDAAPSHSSRGQRGNRGPRVASAVSRGPQIQGRGPVSQ